MTEDAAKPEGGPAEDRKDGAAPALPPQRQRPKMSLEAQSLLILDLLARCKLHTGDMRGRFAGAATLTLTEDDMLRLETIQQTLAIFDQNDAARLVKDEIWRKRRKGGAK